MKKLLSILLSILMAFSVFLTAAPMTALAEGADGDDTRQEETADVKTAIEDAEKAAVEANGKMADVEGFKSENNVTVTADGEGDIDPKAGEDELDALKQNAKDMKDANDAADAAENSNNQLISNAADVASTINRKIATAAESLKEKKKELQEAASISKAQKAYDAAVTIRAEAETSYKEAVKAYNTILQKIKDNNQKITDAQKKYDAAYAAAKKNLQDAYDELEEARRVAAELEEAANTAKANLGTVAARILAAQEERDKPQNKDDGKKQEDVFTAIIQDYYIPVYKKGTLEKIQRDSHVDEADVGKKASIDGNARNYLVVYNDSEGQHTLYLNFKWDEKGQLIIFEKTLMDIDVYRYMNQSDYVEVDPDADNVVTIGDTKYVLLDEGTTETFVTEGSVKKENSVIKTEISDTADEYVLEDGQVVNNITGTVTTTTTTNKSLGGSETKYGSEAAAEAAARNAIILEDYEELVLDSLDVTTSSETTYGVTYDGEFKATIAINEWRTQVDESFVSEADEAENARKNFAGRIEKMIQDAGFELVEDIDLSNISMKSYWFFDGSLTKKTYVVNGNYLITVKFKKDGIVAGDVVETGSNSATRDAVASAQVHSQSIRVDAFNINKVTLTNIAATSKGTTYTYDGASYKVATVKIDEDQVIAKVTYNDGRALQHLEKTGYYSNSNYDKYLWDGNLDHVIMLESPTSSKDLGLNNFLNKYKTDKQNYETLAGKAKEAAEAYAAAEEKVSAIQASLDQLNAEACENGFDAKTLAMQAELEVALKQAERDMDEARETVAKISSLPLKQYAKADPTVTAPTAKTLTYTGTAQELVNAGSATGGTMYYAVTTENTAPTDDNLYTTSIPTATDAGTYNVWYKVNGDENHNDSKSGSVTIVIARGTPVIAALPTAAEITSGQTLADSTLTGGRAKLGKNSVEGIFAWKITGTKPSASDSRKTRYSVIFTPKDKKNLESVECLVMLKVNRVRTSVTVTFKVRNGAWDDDGTKKDRAVTLTGNAGDDLMLEVDDIPDVGDSPDEGYEMGAWKKELPLDKPITADTVYTYVYAKKEPKTEPETAPDSVDPNKRNYHLFQIQQRKAAKHRITFTWKKVSGASSYTVYGSPCGRTRKMKKIDTVKKTSFTYKKLKKSRYYKFYVVAKNGKKKIATSTVVHICTAGGKFGNSAAVKVNKKKLRLKVKTTAKLKAKVKNNGKVIVHKAKALSYESSKPKIAKVNKKGKVTAVAQGTCYVYVYAQNGISAKVKVTVE